MSYQNIIFFDLETTGLDPKRCEIIQLSAICGNNTFNAYTRPLGNVDERATEKTGFSVRGEDLYLRENPVPTVTLCQALTSFLAYIKPIQGPVLLAAHNAKRFDWVILTRVLQQFPNLSHQFKWMVPAYLDTLPLSRSVYPGLTSYSLPLLVKHFLGEDFDTHNAMEDARALQKLFYTWNLERSTYSEFVTQV